VAYSDFFEAAWPQAFWGSNYPRVAAVDRHYDPAGLFVVHHGVGTRMMMSAPPTRMRTIRPFTTRVFNPIGRRFAGWLPGFGILQYRGRKSGRTYRTPINAFRRGDSYVFALTYGADVQWVQNVVAAGGCTLRTRGRDVRLVEPELFVDPGRRLMPRVVRVVLRLDRATEFLRMRIATPP
jgi:deazaflavin-dependent oxidoreductase (nitroreductase family)